jgi:peptidoglycan/xylan/chitin deacetylase (PgdA/CDA1 family)
MKAFLKKIIWGILYLGACMVPHRPRCTVLLYHSISNSKDFFAVSPEVFEKQMKYIQKRQSLVSLRDVLNYVQGLPFKRDSVAITFDDGYQDFVKIALPILKRLSIPATVFVLGKDEEVDRFELGNTEQLLTVRDVEQLKNPLITIGSHGVSHRKLTRLPSFEVVQEVHNSKSHIKEMYGIDPVYFAYPKGSWSDEVAVIVENAGYKAAFSVIETAAMKNSPLYAVPRIQIDGSTTWTQFKAKLTPAADWYYWLWKTFPRG